MISHQFKQLVLNRPGKICVAITAAILFTVNAAGQQQLHLAKLEFVGLRSLKNEQVTATSGLEIGQVVDPATLDVAAQKLVNSGLFKRVSYRVRAIKDQATVIFSVEESVRKMPVTFDNFVWLSETELYSAIRDDIPSFDGTVPASGEGGERIAASLRRLLKEKGISGQVEFKTYGTEAGRQEMTFSVKGPSLSICEVSFPGATVIPEDELLKTARPLLQMNYSRKDVALFATQTLLPLYNHMGYLRAHFSIPVATVQDTEQCKNGVAVILTVDEGQPYYWGRAEWTGNKLLTSDQLNAAIGLKAGDLADDRLIAKGLHAASLEYGKKGFMAARWVETTTFDDLNKRVTYHFTVSEGPQFHMGQLTVAGLSEEDANRVRALWQLTPGAVFDQSYLEDFTSNTAREFLSRHPVFSGVPLKVSSDTKVNSANQTVDVTVTFK